MDLESISESDDTLARFKTEFCAELAKAIAAHADEMHVLDLEKGSVVVRVRFTKASAV